MVRQLSSRKSTPLLSRLLSVLLLIPLCLYIIYMGPPYALVLVSVVSVGLFIEWIRLLLKCSLSPVPKAIYALLGSIYLSVAILWFLYYAGLPNGRFLIFCLFFLVWSTDMSAFLGGNLFKGPKLAPSISPHKTWSGFFSGMFGGIIVGYEASLWIFPGVFTFWGIVALVLIAQGGDLLESQAKRWSQVKDSSSLIPGHGGLLDRLDSLIAVSFALALWQTVG